MEIEPIILLGIVVASFFAGWHYREYTASKRVDELLEQWETQATEKATPEHIKIVIEKHNDMFFVYSDEDHTFMAQGTTRKELEDNLAKRFPEKKFAAQPQNLLEVGFL